MGVWLWGRPLTWGFAVLGTVWVGIGRGDKVYEYLSLVESVRDGPKVGHRTLLRLGEVTALRESGQLERIVAALERHLRRERVDVGALAAEGAPGVGAVAAVWAVWQRLGLGEWFAAVGAVRGAWSSPRWPDTSTKSAFDVREWTRHVGKESCWEGNEQEESSRMSSNEMRWRSSAAQANRSARSPTSWGSMTRLWGIGFVRMRSTGVSGKGFPLMSGNGSANSSGRTPGCGWSASS